MARAEVRRDGLATRTFVVTGVLVGVVCGLAACGPVQSSAPARPVPANPLLADPSASSSITGTPECAVPEVSGDFGPLGAADPGTVEAVIVATNNGDHACTLRGYGAVALVPSMAEGPLDLALSKEPEPAPTPVAVEPGRRAYKKLRWAIPHSSADPGCTYPAQWAEVTLPGDIESFEASAAGIDLPGVCGGSIQGFAWTGTDPTR